MLKLILIPHALAAGAAGEGAHARFQGADDPPLSDIGKEQAQATAARLADEPLVGVYASPLQRASLMANLIAHVHRLQAQALAELAPLDYGEWAGLSHAEVESRWPSLYHAWRVDPFSVTIPGGEPPRLHFQRVRRVTDRLIQRYPAGGLVALVAHHTLVKSLSSFLLELPGTTYWRMRHDPGSLTRLQLDPATGRSALHCQNDTRHLRPGPPRLRGRACRVLLVRHGQTAWNAALGAPGLGDATERFRGRTDVPLSAEGHRQAHALAAQLAAEPVTAIYASPLQRTQDTAAPLARGLSMPVGTLEGLWDVDYGALSGLSHAEAAARYPRLYETWRTTPGQVVFPEGEGLATVRIRALDALENVASRYPGETVVLVGHQIVNKVVACALLGLEDDDIWRIDQNTGAVNIFQRDPSGWCVEALNLACPPPETLRHDKDVHDHASGIA